MATVVVEPLGRATFFNKPVRQNALLASIPTPRARENKRPRSPDHGDGSSAKRVRPAQASKATSEKPKVKSQGNSKGESKDEEWKRKYLAYFPTTVFYFDTDHIDNSSLSVMKKRIKSLNGVRICSVTRSYAHDMRRISKNFSRKRSPISSPTWHHPRATLGTAECMQSHRKLRKQAILLSTGGRPLSSTRPCIGVCAFGTWRSSTA